MSHIISFQSSHIIWMHRVLLNTVYQLSYGNLSVPKTPRLKGILFNSHSDLCILLAGGMFPFTVGRISHGFNMRPDLCAQDNPTDPKKYLGSFYTDSLVHDPGALKLLMDVIGKVS